MNNLIISRRSLFNDFDRLFDGFLTGSYSSTTPRVDVRENDADYELVAEVPGFDQENISLQVNDGVLTIDAEQEHANESTGEAKTSDNYLIRERQTLRLARSFRLPKNVEQDKIRAEFKNGLLTLHIPKAEEAQPRTIKIN